MDITNLPPELQNIMEMKTFEVYYINNQDTGEIKLTINTYDHEGYRETFKYSGKKAVEIFKIVNI